MEYRVERDLLGEMQVPLEAYWGIHTQRALRNFPVSGIRVRLEIIRAMAMVKKACCEANIELGYLDEKKGNAISTACDEVIQGVLDEQFPLDAFQGGAGTSINMNVNEVIANRAIELLRGKRGDYSVVHPIEDVNLHQSTNDTFPTAVKVATIYKLRELSGAIARLQGALQRKEKEFASVVKIGRTELQEAVPMTLGAQFSGFAEAISRDRWRTFKCEERLRVVNIGGTAIGTGITAPRDYIFLVVGKLREITGLGLARAENLIGETANVDPFVEVSGIVNAHVTNLIKLSGDLRLMNLLKEIELPSVQAGSSIMPGKLNPVILESVMQVGFWCMASDGVISRVAAHGSFQINEFLPLLSHAMISSTDMLTRTDRVLAKHIDEIRCKSDWCARYVNESTSIITAFLPYIGYKRAEKLLNEFRNIGKGNFREFLNSRLGHDLVDEVLSPYRLTSLGYRRSRR